MDDDELGDTVITPRLAPAESAADAESAAELDTVLRPPVLVEPVPGERQPIDHVPTGQTAVLPALVQPAPGDHGARAGHLATAPVALQRQSAGRYRYSLNGAAPVLLSGTLVIGRNPKPPRVADVPDLEFVTVPSAGREVSATHLRVSQDGASIVVTDLKSTNGTVVTMPGSDSFSLRSGESIVAVPGTMIDIGDGNHLEILPVARMPLATRAGGDRS